MNLYYRTFSVLKPFWKHLISASFSSVFHALFAGMMVWMFGPLLMTLFQIQSNPVIPMTPGNVIEQKAQPDQNSSIWNNMEQTITDAKDEMKVWVKSLVDSDNRKETLVNFCIIILIVVGLKNIFLYLQGFFMAFVQQSIIKKFRDNLFIKYQNLSLDYFHTRRTGQIMSRITNDVTVLNESIDVGFNQLVANTILLLVLFSFLVILSWKLTLMAMLVMPLAFTFIWYIGKKIRKYSERTQERMEDVTSVLEESINNVRIVKAFSMEKHETAKFLKTTYNFFRSVLKMTRVRYLSSPVNDTLATISGVIILFFAGGEIISGTGELDAGDFMTFVLAMMQMIHPVKTLSQIHVKIQEGMAAAKRIFDVIDTEEKIKDAPQSKIKESFDNKIEYRHVSFCYYDNEKVVNDISFEINKGEVIAFVGPSGGGKSTLLDLLPRFYDPQEGGIFIDCANIKEIELLSLRSLMGIVTQETYLFNDTVFNNIAYGLDEIEKERVIQTAKMANAHDFIIELENGYETIVGNRGVKLSGGQRQRLAIARALLKNPQILIFDEATSALDTEAETLVQDAIDKLMKNRTSLVIAHRLSTIKHANRILVIDKGRITEQGNHEHLMALNGIYKKLYDMQFKE